MLRFKSVRCRRSWWCGNPRVPFPEKYSCSCQMRYLTTLLKRFKRVRLKRRVSHQGGTHMPSTKASLLAISLFLSLALPVMGQETTGTILGTVTDSSGAVISGATVTVTNIEKGAVIRK